jgi:hypothetical protein
MYDDWIGTRIQKAIDENRGTADAALLESEKNGPLLAVVFSADLTGDRPYVAAKVQTYPGIKSWGTPFE